MQYNSFQFKNLTISGPVTGSQIGHGSRLRDLSWSQTTSPAPSENEKQQQASNSNIEKWIVPIVIGVIVGLILLLIEHKTSFFGGK